MRVAGEELVLNVRPRPLDYSGEHWLASFALYAYKMKIESNEAQ